MSSVRSSEIELAAKDLWKCYRHHREYVPVLAEVELEIRRGEFVCLVGPSGCGKSTLLSLLAGLETPTLGALSGCANSSAVVFQRDLLLDWKSVLDNVLVGFALRGEPTKQHRDRALALLEQVGLAGTEALHPWQLSGGMRQRVAICRALVQDPQVLFMDEPFGALDALTRERLNEDMLKLAGEEKTVVFVTHDVAEAVFLADRILVMGARPGRIIADIPVDLPRHSPDLRAHPRFGELCAEVRHLLHGVPTREEEAAAR